MTKKRELIIEMLKAGQTYQHIAFHFGLTKQRIAQIAKETGIIPLKLRQDIKNKKYFSKWGHKEKSDLYQACRAKFRQKKANSKREEWTITFGELVWPTHCPVLGIELDYFSEIRVENSVSFDRIDSQKGYITGNVKIISWRANRIKNDGTAEEHRKIAEYIQESTKNL